MDGAAVANAMFDAVEAGDFTRMRALFEPAGAVWQNVGPKRMTLDETVAVLSASRAAMRQMRYGDRRYESLPDGAICQHVVRAAIEGGETLELPSMLRLHIRDGRIHLIEEYFDSGQAAVVAARLERA